MRPEGLFIHIFMFTYPQFVDKTESYPQKNLYSSTFQNGVLSDLLFTLSTAPFFSNFQVETADGFCYYIR